MTTVTKKIIPPMVPIYITESNGQPVQIALWQYNPNKRTRRLVSFAGDTGGKSEQRVLRLPVSKSSIKTAVTSILDRIADMNPAGTAGTVPQLVVLNHRQYKILQDACSNIGDKVNKHVVYLDARIYDIFKYCSDADKIGLEYAANKLNIQCVGKQDSDEYRFIAVFAKTEDMIGALLQNLQPAPQASTANPNSNGAATKKQETQSK